MIKAMTSRRGLCAALLLIAVSSRAQMELRVAPLVSAPAAPLAGAPGPSLAASAPSLAPLASARALALPAAPAALAAPAAEWTRASAAAVPAAVPGAAAVVPATPETIRGAVAQFEKRDFSTLSAGEVHAAGEDLMIQALGGAASGAAPAVPGAPSVAPALAAPDRRLYLLSKPLRTTVQLDVVSRAAHIGGAIAWELLKAWVGWHATGHLMGGVAVMVVELPFSPAMITGRSLLDLGARYWARKLAVLRELARAPGVERVRVLTAGQVEFSGPLARRKENTGLIFVDASQAPAAGRFGAAIPIDDASRQTVRLTLSRADASSSVVWTPTLADLLERRPLPPEIAAAWREALKAAASGSDPAHRLLDAARDLEPTHRLLDSARGRDLRIDAVLVGGPSGDVALGAIVAGPAVKTFIGLGHLDRVRAFFHRALQPRALPLSDTTIARSGEHVDGSWWVRAWRRLTGKLIVAPNERRTN